VSRVVCAAALMLAMRWYLTHEREKALDVTMHASSAGFNHNCG
jgi:hypothetical protein